MSMNAQILAINSLDARYGSSYRIRSLVSQLKNQGFDVNYIEGQGSALQRLLMAAKAARGRYDLLFTQKFNPVTLAAIIIAKWRGKPIIVDWDDLDVGLQGNLFMKMISIVCEWFGPKLANRITTHSSIIRDRALKSCPVDLLPQGINVDLFQPTQRNREADRAEWGFTGRDLVIGHLCTFTYGGTKDLSIILDAFSKITCPDVKFILIGGGPLERQVHRKIDRRNLREQVRVTGLLSQEQIPGILNCLDVGVVFMRDSKANRARVSFKVIEYLAMNVPVVGAVVGETATLFGNQIHSTNQSDLPDEMLRIAKESRHQETAPALQSLSWEKVSPGLIASISSILEGERHAVNITS